MHLSKDFSILVSSTMITTASALAAVLACATAQPQKVCAKYGAEGATVCADEM